MACLECGSITSDDNDVFKFMASYSESILMLGWALRRAIFKVASREAV
jgi:hypothetical protein